MAVTLATPTKVVNNAELFAQAFLKIRDKEKQLVPLVWNKAQRDFHYNRTGRDLILKARQLGFSTYMQGEIFRREVTDTRTTITLAHDAETTQKLRRMADRFWGHCKFNNIQPARKYANSTLTTYPEFDSTAVIATAGNVEVGRGDTYTDLHGSEVAFWPDAERIVAGAMQGGNPDVVLESTPNGSQGFFYDRCMEALTGDGVWKLHFYPWWWDEQYTLVLDPEERIELTDEEHHLSKKHNLSVGQIKWRRAKQKELKRFFIQEYPEDVNTCFLTSGNSFFGDLMQNYNAPYDAAFNPDHRYTAGLDFGQTNDYTALIVIDHTANMMVDFLHINKLEWSEQRRRIIEVCKKWDVQKLVAESNSIGSVNIEAIQHQGITVHPFATTNASKAEIMSDLYESLHSGLQLLDIPVLKHELQTFVSSQTASGVWRLAAEGDGHDDTVIALALANQNLATQVFL